MTTSNAKRSLLNRREFVKKSAAGLFGFTIIPAYLTSARAADNPLLPPSRRVNLGCIGVGGRGHAVVNGLCRGGEALPVAFADVDFRRHERGTRTFRDGVEAIYEINPNVKRYHDFRVMFDEMGDDMDAVCISTPDHTHFVATLHAMALGKHVFTEKPLAHTFLECEILMQAEKKYGVVTQMGNTGHTSAGAEQFKKMVANGIVSEIVKIEAYRSAGGLWFMHQANRIAKYPEGDVVPEDLKSWDLWCGPKEQRPYSEMYHPFDWRGFYLYGGGMLGDWGAHIVDYAHEYLELGLPTKIEAVETFDHNAVIFPRSSHLKFTFPMRSEVLPEVELDWKAGNDFASPTADERYGSRQEKGEIEVPSLGSAGTFLHRRQGDYVIQRGSHASVSRIFPREKMLEFGEKVQAANPTHNHFMNFIAACRKEATTTSGFSRSGVLSQTLILGTIAERLNASLTFDPDNRRFIGNDEANRLLTGPDPRADWKEYYTWV